MNIKQIRHQFPILSANGAEKPLIYLDNAATTQKPWEVIERITHYYSHQNANAHRGIYPLADQATQLYEQARTTVAEFIGASDQEIVFCGGTTDALNTIAFGWGKQHLQPGDQVLVTAQEHHANFVPWQMVCQQLDAELVVLPLDERGTINLEVLEEYLTPQVKVVCLTHISNATGIINPVETIIQMAHKRQALVVLDAAQSISYLPLDVTKLDCDFMVFSGHKIYGPMGIGVLYGKKEYLEAMQPLRYGGGMISQVSAGQTTFRQAPQKFEAGTPPLAQALGLETALKFVQKMGRANLKSHADELTAFARHRLSSIPNLTIYPASGPTGPIVSFNLQDIHPHDVATILGEDNIAVRAGHHCTQPLMQHYKIPGTLRASFAIYNQKWEIDRMVESLHKVKQLLQ